MAVYVGIVAIMWMIYGNICGKKVTLMWVFYGSMCGKKMTVMWVFYGNLCGNNDMTLTAVWVFCGNLCRANIKTVINLQQPGEHASCGYGNDSSGFSYNPQRLMDRGSESRV